MHISANTWDGRRACMNTGASVHAHPSISSATAKEEGETCTVSLALRGLVLDQSRVSASIVKNLPLDVRTPARFLAQTMCNLRAASAQFMNKLFDAESPRGASRSPLLNLKQLPAEDYCHSATGRGSTSLTGRRHFITAREPVSRCDGKFIVNPYCEHFYRVMAIRGTAGHRGSRKNALLFATKCVTFFFWRWQRFTPCGSRGVPPLFSPLRLSIYSLSSGSQVITGVL